jgi:hypothetical protein
VKHKLVTPSKALNINTELQNRFECWQHRMQLCIKPEGDYFHGGHSSFPEFVK